MAIVFKPVIKPSTLKGAKAGELGPCQMRSVHFPGVGDRSLERNTADAWEAMATVCKGETGYQLSTVGAYRSKARCIEMFYERMLPRYNPLTTTTTTRTGPDGKKWYLKRGMAPVAGFTNGEPDSNHAWGLANDTSIWMRAWDVKLKQTRWMQVGITSREATYVDKVTGKTRIVWDWIVDNAEHFGFSWEGARPGTKGWEPWHLRYVAGDVVPQRVKDVWNYFKNLAAA